MALLDSASFLEQDDRLITEAMIVINDNTL